MCSKYHGHTHYYQATMLVIVINCPRLFVVAMAMVDTCVQSITALSSIFRLFVDCYHGDGSDGRHVYKVSRPYVLLSATCVAKGALYPEAIW